MGFSDGGDISMSDVVVDGVLAYIIIEYKIIFLAISVNVLFGVCFLRAQFGRTIVQYQR